MSKKVTHSILNELSNEMHGESAKENIGKKAIKKSKKRFASTLYEQTIKDVIRNPHNNNFAYTFVECDKPVDCDKCTILE